MFPQRLDWLTISLLNSGFNFSSTWEKSKRDWEQHGHSGSRGIWASSSGGKSPASRKSSNSSSRQLDPWWFWHWDQWCKWISTSSQSLPISSLATKQVGTFGFNFTPSSFALFHFYRLLEEAMALSSCSNGSLEPLDSDGLVAHNDQVFSFSSLMSRRGLNFCFLGATADGWDFLAAQGWGLDNSSKFFSCWPVNQLSPVCQVTQLRRDLTLSRLALQQVISDSNLNLKCFSHKWTNCLS